MWMTIRRTFWQWHGVLITAPSVTGLVILLRSTGALYPLEQMILEQAHRRYTPTIAPITNVAPDLPVYGPDLPDLGHATDPLLDPRSLAPDTALVPTSQFPRRSPEDWDGWIIAGCALLGSGVVWQLRSSHHWLRAFGVTVATASLITGAYGAFLQGRLFPVVPGGMAFAGSTVLLSLYRSWQVNQLRRSFGASLTNRAIARLLLDPEPHQLSGQTCTVTVLSAHLQGFTRLSTQLNATQSVQILNAYLESMTEVARQYQGILIGEATDGLTVIFGAPVRQVDDVQRAVACAIAMQLAMESVNHHSHLWGVPPIQMGIGVHTGDVMVGTLGSLPDRKYRAVGQALDLASAIESFAVGGQVLISESTFDLVKSVAKVDGQTQAIVQGTDSPMLLYEVSGITGTYNVFLPDDQDAFITLKDEIPLQYVLLEDIQLLDEPFLGWLVRLSSKGAEIHADYVPPPLSHLKLTLILNSVPRPTPDDRMGMLSSDDRVTERISDIHAQVLNRPVAGGFGFHVRFTLLPPNATEVLQRLRSDRRIRKSS